VRIENSSLFFFCGLDGDVVVMLQDLLGR